MKLVVIAIGLIIVGSWILGRMLFQGKKGPLTIRDKVLAWLFFGGPFIVDLMYRRNLTKRELIGWGIFVLVFLAGLAFQYITCLGVGRGQSCMQ